MPEPTPQELIAEARKIGPMTRYEDVRWRPSEFVRLLADALEASEFECRRVRDAMQAGWTWGQYEWALSQESDEDA